MQNIHIATYLLPVVKGYILCIVYISPFSLPRFHFFYPCTFLIIEFKFEHRFNLEKKCKLSSNYLLVARRLDTLALSREMTARLAMVGSSTIPVNFRISARFNIKTFFSRLLLFWTVSVQSFFCQ